MKHMSSPGRSLRFVERVSLQDVVSKVKAEHLADGVEKNNKSPPTRF